MGACNSKKPSDPSAQATHVDACPKAQPGSKPSEDAPVLLADPGAVCSPKGHIKSGSPKAELIEDVPVQGAADEAVNKEADASPAEVAPVPAVEESPVPAPASTPKEMFEAALAWVKDPANTMKGVPNSGRLNLYKFYKQATEGDVKGSQPWATQLEARAKWDAWSSVRGLSSEDAMKGYVQELESQKQRYGGK